MKPDSFSDCFTRSDTRVAKEAWSLDMVCSRLFGGSTSSEMFSSTGGRSASGDPFACLAEPPSGCIGPAVWPGAPAAADGVLRAAVFSVAPRLRLAGEALSEAGALRFVGLSERP